MARENPTTNKNKCSNDKGKGNEKSNTTQNPIKVKITTAERITPVTLMLAVAILTRRSPTPTFPQSLEKTASSHKQSNSAISSRTSACSVAKLDTSPKSVPKGNFLCHQSLLHHCHRQELRCQVWHGVKKSVSSPQHSAPIEDCVELTSAPMEPQLNTSDSLMITLNSNLLPTTDICTLIDSGSTHCFLNSTTILKHQLCTYKINLMPLQLFNSTTNSDIHSAVDLLLCFPSGDKQTVMFYITLLEYNSFTLY